MKASLVSASSLLALLLSGRSQAVAAPDLSLLQPTISFGDTLDNPAVTRKRARPAGTAPAAAVALRTAVPDIRFGVTTTPVFATGAIKQAAGTGQLVFDPDVTDAAAPSSIATNGTLSLIRTPGWRRTIEAGHSVFAGFGGAITPEDSARAVSSNSASFAYTFSPADTDSAPADSLQPAGNMSGESGGATAFAPHAGTLAKSASSSLLLAPNNGGANALGYGYRPHGGRMPVNAVTAQPSSSPLVASTLPQSVASTGRPDLGGSAGIDVAAAKPEHAGAVGWVLRDLASAGTGGDPLLAGLTIEEYLISNPATRLPDNVPGGTIAGDDTLTIPMIAVGTGVGELASTLTSFTSEGAGMDGIGEAYVSFDGSPAMATVTRPAGSLAPRVAAAAVLSVGLIGLAAIFRRRQMA